MLKASKTNPKELCPGHSMLDSNHHAPNQELARSLWGFCGRSPPWGVPTSGVQCPAFSLCAAQQLRSSQVCPPNLKIRELQVLNSIFKILAVASSSTSRTTGSARIRD